MWHKRLKDYFIPHEGNSFAPHSLQKAALLGMLVLIVLSFTVANVQSLLWISSKFMTSSVLPAVIVDLTNKERTNDSLGTLHRNALLDEAATLKAQDMAKNEYFAHYSPAGLSPWYWFKKVSYNFVNAGENLAIQFTDSSAIVDAWMASPEHRANILNGKYTEIGVGTAEGMYQGYHTVYVVQLFGTPAAPIAVASTVAAPTVVPKSAPTTAAATSSKPSVLAEAVSVTQQVKTIPAPAQKIVLSSSAPTEAPTSTQGASLQNATMTASSSMISSTAGTTMYSSFIATTTGGTPATIHMDNGIDTQAHKVPYYYKAATEPNMVLQVLYVIIGLFVMVSLLMSIFIEIRHQQPMQIAYGVALLFLMFGLFYMHAVLSSGVLIV